MITKLKFLHVLLCLSVFLQESCLGQNQQFAYNGSTGGADLYLDGLARSRTGQAFLPFPINLSTTSSSDNISASSLSSSTQFMFSKPLLFWIDVNNLKSNVSSHWVPCSNPCRDLVSSEEKQVNVTIAPLNITKPSKPLSSASLNLSLVPHIRRKPQMNKEATLILVVIVVALVLFLILGAVYVVRRKKYEEVYEDWEQMYGPQRFSYRDLYKATKGFKDSELLGCGGFGRVYRGVLPSNDNQVAVKKMSHDSQQGVKEFVAEVASMKRLRHRNLVQLLGYCRRKRELLLVYEYMPNGSVDRFLFSTETPDLNWNRRFQILKDVASALLYLHEGWEQVVTHRDVKAANIMLDADFNAKLGDFGLARFCDHGSTPQTTCVVGTIGYLAPEVLRTGKASTSGDVFAFGAFMLEMACGRKPVEPEKSPEEVVLVDLVLHWWNRRRISRASDPTLRRNYAVQEMELVLKLGLLCSLHTPEARPSMRQVMQLLAGETPFPEADLNSATSGCPARTDHQSSGQHQPPLSSSATSEYDYSGVSMSTTASALTFGR